MVTIGIVDDNATTLQKISYLLRKESWLNVVVEALDGYALIDYCNTKSVPDILLVDVNMLKMDGVAVASYLYDHYPQIKVIGVSTYTDREIVEDMLAVGAWGYVTKLNLGCLIDAIRSVVNNTVYIDPFTQVDGSVRESLMLERKEQKAANTQLHITKREATFITLNATGLEYAEIAKLMFVERKTIDNVFANVAKKINIKNRQNLTLFSIRNSLIKIVRLGKYKDGK